jgi:plastocyanin
MRASRVVLLIIVAAAVLAGVLGFAFIRREGLAADRAPGRLETAIARRIVRLSIPASERNARNPYAENATAWRDGADHFADHCAVCHGADGRGGSAFGRKMYPPVPDLASADVQQLSDGAIFAIIQRGVRWTGMPAFRSEHSADETWKLVSFIRRVPQLTPADLAPAHEHAGGHEHGPGEEAEHTHDAPDTVTMDGTTFHPPTMTVKVGETVVWANKDPFPHNVTSSAGGFRSGDLDPDREWRFRTTRKGTFRYVCTLHPGMSAVLVVK